MFFTANPYYYQGQPATSNIAVRIFNTPEQAVAALAAGEVGWDTLFPNEEQMSSLLEAQAAGKVRVYLIPVGTWEHIDFALFAK
jgi:ABC-type transport system substrate-binding protein